MPFESRLNNLIINEIAASGSARAVHLGCTLGLNCFRPGPYTCLARIAAILFYLLPRFQVPEYFDIWRAVTFDSPPPSPSVLADAALPDPHSAPSGDHNCCLLDGTLVEGLDRLQLSETTTGTSSDCPTDQGILAIESWLKSTCDSTNIYTNACHAANVASSLYDH